MTASLVVLISGGGSNLQAIIDAIASKQLNAEIKTVISNKENITGLERADRAGIATHVIDHQQFSSREAFDQAMIEIIDPLQPDLVILAGFMRILSNDFIDHYQHRLINIHPSLLPKYKGLNTHQQAIANHDEVHGASVHYVSHELDSGPIVIQAEIPVHAEDTTDILAERVLHEEHQIYPLAIQMHIEGRITFDGHLKLDGQPLTRPLQWKDGQLLR
ncbi:MAG: phosphoribosylglycinamide formyltransferase [Gammaproteobacteria bacterium]|nr:phosphoribosylglycinamide formyltransferase [Gammaproteobacteria bacterium]